MIVVIYDRERPEVRIQAGTGKSWKESCNEAFYSEGERTRSAEFFLDVCCMGPESEPEK
jgi:hypothetical protein